MKKRIGIVVVALGVFAAMGAAIRNYTEPLTQAYEINPITFEVREVEYRDRPITGRTDFEVLRQKEMKIGNWLREHGYLRVEGPGYWTLVKSFNRRWGFVKGPGRAFHSVFDQSGSLSPMPHPNPDGPNKDLVEWCLKYPARARLVWDKYMELTKEPNSSELWRAGEMLRWSFGFSDEYDDETFQSVLIRETNF